MHKKNVLSYFKNATSKNWNDWQWQFQNRITKAPQLEYFFSNSFLHTEDFKKVTSIYPLSVTPYYLSLIQANTEYDPILAQCVPNLREILCYTDYSDDPLQENTHMPVEQLIHRYPDRCLVMVTEICATYCRHCNRKRYWNLSTKYSLKNRLNTMINYISKTPQIREVIISGGDPLIYNDEKLEMILASIKSITHVEVLRIGSRIPAVMPMRITKELCRIFKRYRPLWFNTQFNHPSEITPESKRACNMLQDAGIPVSNQSVLLKGINDSPAVMRQLLYALQKISVRPYYLFHCEPVKGCGHFRTNIQSGMKMMERLRRDCSGLAWPQYVADLPGQVGKVPILCLSDTIKNDLNNHQDFFDNFE
jgi:lysine 2,3-aminomutase